MKELGICPECGEWVWDADKAGECCGIPFYECKGCGAEFEVRRGTPGRLKEVEL